MLSSRWFNVSFVWKHCHSFGKLISRQVFYHLDYLKQEERPQATTFRHRAHSAHRRQRSVKSVDLSHIEDPLLLQAGCYSHDDASRPSTPTKKRNSLDFANKRCLTLTRSTGLSAAVNYIQGSSAQQMFFRSQASTIWVTYVTERRKG